MGTDRQVVVIGGGATGVGIARDLAMRGVAVDLVERGGLATGTTGRMHGLLHSGARYANDDPESAADCLAENRVLRDIAGQFVVASGGLFVQGPDDDPGYFEAKAEACAAAGIPTERLDGTEASETEPTLSRDIERALEVPDAVIDPAAVTAATALSAEEHGARIRTKAPVVDLVRKGDEVTGVAIDGPNGDRTVLAADHVVNATGPWTDHIAAMADCSIGIRHSKGSMVVLPQPAQETVVNWCRPRGQADIVVPFSGEVVLGTTDIPVDGPTATTVEAWEIETLVEEMTTLLPGLADVPVERAYAGVRPLYSSGDVGSTETENVTRDFFVIDHGAGDGIEGLTSIVGGKFTTHRLMAERTADLVATRLGVDEPSRTAEGTLPGADDPAVIREAKTRFRSESCLPD